MSDFDMIEKLKKIAGQEMKYGQLCDSLGLPKKSSRGKDRQLGDLRMYCDLERLERPTRYVIKEVYEEAVKALGWIHGRNKFQRWFDAVVFSAFIKNDFRPIFLSGNDMLKLFGEVNEDFFKFYYGRADDVDYVEMSVAAKRILVRWATDRINNMRDRDLIIKESAFRLYQEVKSGDYTLRIGHNVGQGSDLFLKCLRISAQAKIDVIGYDFDYKWLSKAKWDELTERIDQIVKDKFYGAFVSMKPITAILPPEREFVKEQLARLYDEEPELKAINDESCRKILATKQLDHFGPTERKDFVNRAIKIDF